MNDRMTPDQEALCRAVQEFAHSRLSGDMIRRDRDAVFDHEGFRACAEMGIQGLPLPQDLGGQGQDFTTSLLVLQALGEACTDNGLVFSISAQTWSVAMPILQFGTKEQKKRYLPGLNCGALIGAHGMTEPDSGSDALALSTRAVRDGDHYVLHGTKTFCTNGPIGDFALVFANARPELKAMGITAFLVDRETPGVTFGPPIEKMGLRTSPMGEIVMEEAHVPISARLGGEGSGMMLFQSSMEYERAFIFASHLGAMRRLYARCSEHAKTRHQFRQPIAKFPAVFERLVSMWTDVELGDLLLRKIAWAKDRGAEVPMEAAMAKLFVSEAYVRATLDAIQIFGGYGYTVEYEVEREHRDAIASRIYSGTSEIQRKLIAHYLGL
jgi:alkylation response protein AidB-like acyl-CoA dehydrogenase